MENLKSTSGTQQIGTCAVVDDGTKEINLVNKFGHQICKVYIRTGDLSIIDRFEAFVKDIDSIIEPIKNIGLNNDGTASLEKDMDILRSVEGEIKNRFNLLFDMEDADAIFEKRHAFSSVSGEFFCTRVLMALQEVVVKTIEEEAELSKKRTAKYLEDINQK